MNITGFVRYVGVAAAIMPLLSFGGAEQRPWQFSFDAAYQRDSFDWNIAGDPQPNGTYYPNILSELKWDAMNVLELRLGGEYRVRNLALAMRIGHGDILSGRNQDSDYDGNYRTQEFSRTINDADGSTLDVTVEASLRLPLRELSREATEIVVVPSVGFSYYEQSLNIFNGNQVIPDLGPFDGLYTQYNTRWRMPWLGATLAVSDAEDRTFELGGVLYGRPSNGYYNADADWNLRDNFDHPVSFRHEARAVGYGWRAGVHFPFNNDWNAFVRVERRVFTSGIGKDVTYVLVSTSSGTEVVEAEGRLNDVNWDTLTFLRVGLETRPR